MSLVNYVIVLAGLDDDPRRIHERCAASHRYRAFRRH